MVCQHLPASDLRFRIQWSRSYDGQNVAGPVQRLEVARRQCSEPCIERLQQGGIQCLRRHASQQTPRDSSCQALGFDLQLMAHLLPFAFKPGVRRTTHLGRRSRCLSKNPGAFGFGDAVGIGLDAGLSAAKACSRRVALSAASLTCLSATPASESNFSAAFLRAAMISTTGRNRKRRSSHSRMRTLTACSASVGQSKRISAKTGWRTTEPTR